MKNIKFTILELFVSIACIVIISLLIIPFVSRIFTVTEKKVFVEFAKSVYQKTIDDAKNYEKEDDFCYIYDIKKDLKFDELGSFEGYSIVKDNSVYLFIHNQYYSVTNFKYSDIKLSMNDIKDYNSDTFNLEDFVNSINCKNSEYISK
jgi:hypothetical protein